MTQAELGSKVGMPQPSIARIERGTVMPLAATLLTLLQATGHDLTVEPAGPAVDLAPIRRRLSHSLPRRTRDAIGRAAKDPARSPVRILRRLRLHNVPFVLIGELAEVAHGSPGTVRMIEVCHATTDVARDRLAKALDDLGEAGSPKRLRLVTETAAGDDYDALMRNATNMHVDAGIQMRVAALEDLIRVRKARRTVEDLEAAALLRAIADVVR